MRLYDARRVAAALQLHGYTVVAWAPGSDYFIVTDEPGVDPAVVMIGLLPGRLVASDDLAGALRAVGVNPDPVFVTLDEMEGAG